MIERFIVAIGTGASRFVHAETVRFGWALTRLFGWARFPGHNAIARLFEPFDMLSDERVQAEANRWLFHAHVPALKPITLALAIGACWHPDATQQTLMLAAPQRIRARFAGL